jgi:NitT/TauT family transport system substrate-binding protein
LFFKKLFSGNGKIMMHKRWISGFIICALAAFVLFWFGWGKETEQTPLRIGTNPWPGYEFIHLADKKGFFKEEGVNVKLVRFSALEDARRAFERGQVDGMASTLIELLQAHEHGMAGKILLMTDFSNGSDVIIARKGINRPADLKGKKMGAESASLGVFVVARALDKAGLSLDSIKLVSMGPLNMEKALLSGEVDALHTYPPYSTNILKHKDAVTKIFDSTQIPGEIVDIVSFSPDTIDHRMKDLIAIRRAWDKTVVYARQHPEESNKIMAEVEGISAEEFADALSGVKVLSLAEQQPLMTRGGTVDKTLKQVAEILHKGGHLQNAAVQPDDYLLRAEDASP